MTAEIFNPVVIEQKIADVSNRIAQGVNLADEKYREFLDADRVYDAAFARAYMTYSGPAHSKRYAAELETGAERAARDVADAAYRYTDRRTRAYQDELRSLQSINKSVLMAYQTAGVGER